MGAGGQARAAGAQLRLHPTPTPQPGALDEGTCLLQQSQAHQQAQWRGQVGVRAGGWGPTLGGPVTLHLLVAESWKGAAGLEVKSAFLN